MEAEPTISDVLDAVSKGFSGVQVEIEGMKTDVAGLKSDVAGLKSDIAGLKADVTGIKVDVTGLKTDVTSIKAGMVTKDYLDEKLGQRDGHMNRLVNVLERKKVLTLEDRRAILA